MRGIYPLELDTLSVDTLRWQGVELNITPDQLSGLIGQLKQYADKCFYISSREELFTETRLQRQELHAAIEKILEEVPEVAVKLGLDPNHGFEVHSLHRSLRVGPDGQYLPQIIMALTQTRRLKLDGTDEAHDFRGGTTLIIDLSKVEIQYAIIKRLNSDTREARTIDFVKQAMQDPLQRLLLTPTQEPFGAMHTLGDVVS